MVESDPVAALGREHRLKLSSHSSKSQRWIEWISVASAGGGVINPYFCLKGLHSPFHRASGLLMPFAVDGMDKYDTSADQVWP